MADVELGDYPELTNRRRFLEALYDGLQTAYDVGWDRTMIVAHLEPVPKVSELKPSERNIGEELGLRGGEAVGLLRRLEQEGYVHVSRGKGRGPIGMDLLSLHYLTDKGLRELGQLPDPGDDLIAAFEAARERLEQADMPEPKRRELLDRARLVIDTLRTAEGLADLAGRTFLGG